MQQSLLFRQSKRLFFLSLFSFAATISSHTQFKTLFTFDKIDGSRPYGSLIQGLDGNLYGTTSGGGANSGGTIFKISPAGELTTLYNFCAKQNCSDGQLTKGGLTLDSDGNFFGVTTYGGGNDSATCLGSGCGTVFEITPAGDLTTLYRFCSLANCGDGLFPSFVPESNLITGLDGDLYGTTTFGGMSVNCLYHFSDGISECGTVFKIARSGAFTTIHNLCRGLGPCDGADPGQMVLGIDGNIYGATGTGGPSEAGTIFEITTDGTYSTLYNFCSLAKCADGDGPAGVLQAADGNLYGTTLVGGIGNEVCTTLTQQTCGTIFKFSPDGTLTTLHAFCSLPNCADGALPQTGLIQGSDGNLYGITPYGGIYGNGTLFRITPSGEFTTLHSFRINRPSGSLVQTTNGNLYGTTLGEPGGPEGFKTAGTVFEWTTNLKPFVASVPQVAKAGARVLILGSGFTGASAVSFNGTSAAFTVVSDTEISTSVPAGATSGSITVTTPTSRLSSITAFSIP